MRELLKAARTRLDNACKGHDDIGAVSYQLGYIQAIKDVNRKLKLEGLDELGED
jgi:hypothetical protein